MPDVLVAGAGPTGLPAPGCGCRGLWRFREVVRVAAG
jgi:hypothetical protein